jgi:hypothetical protein
VFGNFNLQKKEKQLFTSVDSRINISRHVSLQAGIASDYSKVEYVNTFPQIPFFVFPTDSTYSFENIIENHNLEAYIYGKAIMGNFILGVGTRKNLPVNNQRNYWSYQANLKYNFNHKNSLLLSGGKYNGYSIPDYFILDFYHVNSTQVAVDYMFKSHRFNTNISLYTKKENVPLFHQEFNERGLTEIKYSGIELSFDYSVAQFYFSVSYILLNAKIKRDEEWFKNYNDMNYFVRGTISYYNLKLFNASLNFAFRPGLHYTPIVETVYYAPADNYIPVFGKLNSKQYENYASVDFTLNKVISYKSTSMVLFCTVTNLLNISNQASVIYNFDYSVQGSWFYQKRLFFFGVMMTL